MPSLEKDRLAAEAMQCWADFQEGLSSDKQKYPVQQFRSFWAVTKRYAELTRLSACSASFLADMTRISKGMNPGIVRDDHRDVAFAYAQC